MINIIPILLLIKLTSCSPVRLEQNNNTNSNTEIPNSQDTVGSKTLQVFKQSDIPRFRIENTREIDENNIEHILVSIIDSSGSVTNSIDVFHSNPFPVSDLTIMPNESRHEFYFLKVPGDGSKNNLKKFFGPEVYNFIPGDARFEKIYVQNSIEFSSNKFLLLTYTMELHLSYYETYVNGYSSSITLIYNTNGDLLFKHKIDGTPNGTPIISADGKYLAYLKINEFAPDSQKYIYNIFSLPENKLVYSIPNPDSNLDRSYTGLNVKKNLIEISLIGHKEGSLVYLDTKNDQLHILRKKIPQLYARKQFVDDYIEVYFREKPAERLSFEKDFDVIKFNY